ncbi:MAG: hypothetical protein WBQ95_16355 [Terracidiphilus sp.]
MATAELLPLYTKLSQRILRTAARRREPGGNQIVEGPALFWLSLRCPMHAWSWPRTNHEERFEGFDAHQTCHKCTSRRMFDTREWRSGPVYRHMVRPEAACEECSANSGKTEHSFSSGYFADWIRSWTV